MSYLETSRIHVIRYTTSEVVSYGEGYCEVAGGVNNWIGNWLGDRKQRAAVSGRMSCWEDVTSEAPQGSVLGLVLLFIIYVNDLDSGVNSRLSKCCR